MDPVSSPQDTRIESISAKLTVLGDGRLWGLALPASRLRPVFTARLPGEEAGCQVVARQGYPFAIEQRIGVLRSALQNDDRVEQYRALFAVALALLCRAHAIDCARAAQLLKVDSSQLSQLATDVFETIGCQPHPATAFSVHEPDHD